MQLKDIDILKELKKRYDSHKVSLLVGAGFTKNAFKSSPSWSELLNDLVGDAYKEELDERYTSYLYQCHGLPAPKADKLKQWIPQIIRRDGYLNVVSKYIEVKGQREAIDVYIEKYNPYVETSGRNIVVTCKSHPYVITDKDLDTHKALLKCKWVNVFTTNFDNFLEYTADRFHLDYQKITKDYELSQKHDDCIVKIHGDLVKESESLIKPFEFDHDHTIRYIISKEDFDTYRIRHEAFSYYLRTALLTGCYCLVGFSGDDPNYKGWLNWVKDILDRNAGQDLDQAEEIKVFMVSFCPSSLPLEQQIYNRNHHISILHLMDPDVEKEIGADTLLPTDYSGHLCKFFDYFNRNSGQQNLSTLISRAEKAIYDEVRLKEIYAKISNLIKEAPLQIVRNHNIQTYLSSFLVRKDIPTETAQRIFVLAVHYGGYLPSAFDKDIEKKLPAVLEAWKDETDRQAIFAIERYGNDIRLDKDIYEKIWLELIKLNFKDAKSLLEDWKATGYDVLKKLSLMTLFGKRADIVNVLDEQMTQLTNVQSRYQAVHLHNLLAPWTSRINPVNYKNVTGYFEIEKEILRNSQSNKQHLSGYGDFFEYRELNRDDNPTCESIKFLQLTLDSGFLPVYGVESIVTAEQWYILFQYAYKTAPDICYFISLLYNNRHVQKRIGEDFAYSDMLQDQVIPALINRSQEALLAEDTTVQIITGILQTSYPLYASARKNTWIGRYLSILSGMLVNDGNKYIYSYSLRTFSMEVAKYVPDAYDISEALSCFLKAIYNAGVEISHFIPYGLQLNKVENLTDEQKEIIFGLEKKYPLKESIPVFYWLDCYKLLPVEIKARLQEQASKDDLSELDNYQLFCLAMTCKSSEAAVNAIKERILTLNIWDYRLSGTYNPDIGYFHIMELPEEYTWSEDELEWIKNNLKKNLNEISSPLQTMFYEREGNLTIVPLLEDMESFLSKYFPNDNTKGVLGMVERALASLRGWNNIEEGLHHYQDKNLLMAMQCLYKQTKDKPYSEYEKYFKDILELSFTKDGYVLTNILSYIHYVVSNETDTVLKNKEYTDKLTWMLQRLMTKDLRSFDVKVVECTYYLSDIATILRDRGIEDYSIDYWTSRTSRFNFSYIINEISMSKSHLE